jgi:hypothetical protein
MKSKSPLPLRLAAGASAAAIILGLAACGTIDIASSWRTSEIVVDGRSGDWGGHLRVIENTPYAIGVLNDGDDLYVCLRGDLTAGAGGFERTGLTVWVDPKGGKGEVLGVHFPIGMEMDDVRGAGERFDDPSMPGRRNRPPSGNQEDMIPDEVEILGPGREPLTRVKRDDLKGIQVALSRSQEGFIYELKIPLKKSEGVLYAAEVPPGGIVGVGFVPGERTGGLMGNRGMGGAPPGMGGMGGRGGMGGPGGATSRGAGGMRGGAEPFNAWLKVTLASPPEAIKN